MRQGTKGGSTTSAPDPLDVEAGARLTDLVTQAREGDGDAQGRRAQGAGDPAHLLAVGVGDRRARGRGRGAVEEQALHQPVHVPAAAHPHHRLLAHVAALGGVEEGVEARLHGEGVAGELGAPGREARLDPEHLAGAGIAGGDTRRGQRRHHRVDVRGGAEDGGVGDAVEAEAGDGDRAAGEGAGEVGVVPRPGGRRRGGRRPAPGPRVRRPGGSGDWRGRGRRRRR